MEEGGGNERAVESEREEGRCCWREAAREAPPPPNDGRLDATERSAKSITKHLRSREDGGGGTKAVPRGRKVADAL